MKQMVAVAGSTIQTGRAGTCIEVIGKKATRKLSELIDERDSCGFRSASISNSKQAAKNLRLCSEQWSSHSFVAGAGSFGGGNFASSSASIFLKSSRSRSGVRSSSFFILAWL